VPRCGREEKHGVVGAVRALKACKHDEKKSEIVS